MGLKLVVKDEIFYPKNYGLNKGDVLDIVLVGSGGYGGTSPSSVIPGYGAGTPSSFGNYVIARSAQGAPGGTGWFLNSYSGNGVYSGGGGGGGYVPGAAYQGGSGASAPKTNGGHSVVLIGNGGGASQPGYINSSTWYTSPSVSMGGNSACFGGGASTDGQSYSIAEGGAGYGAGGGAGYGYQSSQSQSIYKGGYAGEIVYYSHILTEDDVENGININIGKAAIYCEVYGFSGKILPQNGEASKSLNVLSNGWDSQYSVKLDTIENLLFDKDLFYKTVSSGNCGTYPITLFKDGSMILSSYNFQNFYQTSSLSLNQSLNCVYSNTTKEIYSFSTCFPNFQLDIMNYPIFKIGNYFVQRYSYQNTSPNSNITLKYIQCDVALSGKATGNDTKQIVWTRPGNSTGSYVFGFDNNNNLICVTGQKQFVYWENWTPESDMETYETVNTDQNIYNYSSSSCFLFPYKNGAIVCQMGQSFTTSNIQYCYIQDIAKGTVSTTSYYNQYIIGYVEGTDEFIKMCSVYSTNQYKNAYAPKIIDLSTNPQTQSSGYPSIPFKTKLWINNQYQNTDLSLNYVGTNDSYGFGGSILWLSKDKDWIVFSHNMSTGTNYPSNVSNLNDFSLYLFIKALKGQRYGYNNNPGCPGIVNNRIGKNYIGSGAGGCCMITW